MDYIYELRANVKMNGKEYSIREGFFSSVDAAYNYLTRVGVPTIIGQNDNSEDAIKNSMKNRVKIHVVVPAHTDEETCVFVDEYEQDYVIYPHYVNE